MCGSAMPFHTKWMFPRCTEQMWKPIVEKWNLLSSTFRTILYICSVGGLKEGLVVELANNSKAMVLEAKGTHCFRG